MFVLKCLRCGQTCTAKGEDEPETNSVTIDEFISPCDCLSNGGDFEIVEAMDPPGPELSDIA